MALPIESQNKVRFGAFEVDLRTAELRTNGDKLTLQAQPFQVLMVLLERPGQLVTREELRKKLWASDTFVDFEHSLNKAVNRLREALDDSAGHPKFVETLPRKGYRWIGPLAGNGNDHELGGDLLGLSKPGHSAESKARGGKIWKIAVPVGGIAMAVAIGSFMLHPRRPPPLSEKDTIVLADFVNTTGDPVFDDTLKQGLAVQLSQSPFFNLLSDQGVGEALKGMGRSPSGQLTPALAREICVRSSSKVMLAGSISSLGSQYVIGIKAVNCDSGEVFAQEQVQASAKEDVLKVLGQETTRLRQQLGESLSSIQRFDLSFFPVTTTSLGALKAFSMAEIVRSGKGDRAAIPFLRRAIELDPNFAMAHAYLGTMYANLQETGLSSMSMKRAYELRDRLSESERFYIESHYHHFVTGELEKANQTYELWAQTYPRDNGPLCNLGASYWAMGQYDT